MLKRYKNLLKIAIVCCTTAMFAVGTCSAISPQKLNSTETSIPLLQGGVSITSNPRKISMSLRESDARQVLRMLADKAGMNIILHDSVSGTVTLDLVNVTLNKAFEYVMVMNNLAYWVDGNTLIVASKDASKDLAFSQQQIRTFDIKYENAGRIAEFLNKNIFKLKNPGLSNDEVAMSNPNTNQVMIVGTNKDFEIARKIIAQLDKKNETVMFKVNHITPGKMAGIVCNKVFKSEDIKDEDDDAEGKGGAKIACSAKDIEGSEVEGTYSSFKGNGLTVTYYPDNGMIGITGATREQLLLVDEVISQNDVKQKQAIIEVAFIELSDSGSKELNPQWAINSGAFKMGFDGNSFTINNSVYKEDGSRSGTSLGIMAKIEAVVSQGKGRVLSNPKLLVKNNQEATFDITQEYISNVTTQIGTSGSSVATTVSAKNYEKDEYGIKMTIKPTITPDGYVYMDLNPEYSVPNGEYNMGDEQKKEMVALLAERELELKGLRVKDNETLILGGMIYEHETKTVNKVPILGDIPFLGVAFRNSAKTMQKNELIIIITPKIMNDDEAITEKM